MRASPINRFHALLLAVPILAVIASGPTLGAPAETPLQEFQCKGEPRSIRIYEDTSERNSRMIRRLFSDGSGREEFALRTDTGDYVAYRYPGNLEELRYFPKSKQLQVLVRGPYVQNPIEQTCTATSPERPASGVVVPLTWTRYVCPESTDSPTVRVATISRTRVRVRQDLSDGTTLEQHMTVVPDKQGDKWFSDESMRKQQSAWGKAQGPGFESFHLRSIKKGSAIEFWSQGGGKQDAAKPYATCTLAK